MARHREGELGGIQGRVGTMVVSKWKNKTVVRRAPRFSENRKFSQGQLEQHAKFRLATKFFKSFTGLLKDSYEPAKDQSQRNEAFKNTIENAIIGDYPNYQLDYNKIRVSKGKLKIPLEAYVEAATGAVRFNWHPLAIPGQAEGNDRSILIVYCPEIDYLVYTIAGAERSVGTSLYNVPYFAGKDVHTWMAFISPDGKYRSDSVYTGTVMVE